MIEILGISFCALFLGVFVKDYSKNVSLIIILAASGLIFYLLINQLIGIFEKLNEMSQAVGSAGEYIKIMVKVLGITLISQFTADMCRDAGENSLANQTETATKIIIVAMVMPLFETVLNIITGLLK